MLAGWVVLNVADWATTALLMRSGFREGNPFQAALLAHGGLLAMAGYKAAVIADGGVATLLGLRLWPRIFVVAMSVGLLLVAATIVNNVFWLVRR
jgi:hypothetical protein